MRKTMAMTAVLAACALAAGCGSSDDDDAGATTAAAGATATAAATTETTAEAGKPAEVAWLTYSYTEYLQAYEKGMKAALDAGGGAMTTFNADFDPGKQLQQCRDAVSSGRYNVIVLSAVSPPTGVPCVQIAKAAGIPVITLGNAVGTDPDALEPQVDGVVASVVLGVDEGAKGISALTEQACAGKDPCNVVADTIPGDPYGVANLKAIEAVPGVKVVAKVNSMYQSALMQKAIPDVITAHPEIDVIATMADNTALATLPALKEAGLDGKVKLVAMGGSREGKAAIADGVLFGTLGSWPERMGKVGGEDAIKAANGEAIEPRGMSAMSLGEPDVVTAETVEEFEPEWGPQPAS